MKDHIRTKILKLRQDLKGSAKEKKDKKIMEKLFLHPLFHKAKTIFLYIPLKDEVSTFEILEKYVKKKKMVVPRVSGKHTLRLYEIDRIDHLEKGAFGILEPKKGRPERNVKKVDLTISPGVAFDKRGYRIGYGRGFMDRLFARMKCPKIGLAYDFQMVAKIPEEPYDVPVDFVITEEKVYRCYL